MKMLGGVLQIASHEKYVCQTGLDLRGPRIQCNAPFEFFGCAGQISLCHERNCQPVMCVFVIRSGGQVELVLFDRLIETPRPTSASPHFRRT